MVCGFMVVFARRKGEVRSGHRRDAGLFGGPGDLPCVPPAPEAAWMGNPAPHCLEFAPDHAILAD